MIPNKGRIDIQTIVILGVLFVFYVFGDTVTTLWLILHPKFVPSSLGISEIILIFVVL